MSDSLPPSPLPLELEDPIPVYVVWRPRERYLVPVLLLLATLFTTLVVGARLQDNFNRGLAAFSASDQSLPLFPLTWILHHPSRLLMGIPFALALMGILLAHEMGHYLYCRYYRVSATPPYFIPAPTLIGTLGAFIRIRSMFPSRRSLFDIGIAGPIAGFVLAVPVSIAGLMLSRPVGSVPASDINLGMPLIFRWIHAVGIHRSVPFDHLLLHPLAVAGWVGMFATSLNLLPGGQLDGGHIVFSLSPRAHRTVSLLAIAALLPLAYYDWIGWLIWAVLLAMTGLRHPTIVRGEPLDTKRKLLAVFAVVMLALSIIPAPFADSGIVSMKGDLLQLGRSLYELIRHAPDIIRYYFRK